MILIKFPFLKQAEEERKSEIFSVKIFSPCLASILNKKVVIRPRVMGNEKAPPVGEAQILSEDTNLKNINSKTKKRGI